MTLRPVCSEPEHTPFVGCHCGRFYVDGEQALELASVHFSAVEAASEAGSTATPIPDATPTSGVHRVPEPLPLQGDVDKSPTSAVRHERPVTPARLSQERERQ